ncbi:response regulator [Bradyrhizobium oligotrophicum S58]|uniref:Response regulator n=1 Tax=Bradyrhizobium oligotrophicum S58 TaxID=1245469 RepID=M4Z5M2_9BRAD|nr:response regulator [Bradyrhizobium oligotrophicum]BAM88271.1 response regulator [Bradyrhizobium oligotrophicum S58]
MSSKARVFVIEADQVVRSALGYILSERHETFTFAEPADALTKAARSAPDVVLVGSSLIADDGAETVAMLARKLNRAGIVVVADSVKAPLALAGLRQGAEAIIAKPITFDGVTHAVESVYARRGTEPGLAKSPRLVPTEISR